MKGIDHDSMETLDPTREPSATVADGVRIHHTLLKGRNMNALSIVEIIEETVKFYSDNIDRRAVADGLCQYTTPDGRHCAVGRCLIDESFVGTGDDGDESGSIDKVWPEDGDLDKALQPRYRGKSVDFWIDLQHLHDSCDAWDRDGITDHGRKIADKLILDYA